MSGLKICSTKTSNHYLNAVRSGKAAYPWKSVTVLCHLSHWKILQEPASLEAKYRGLWSKFIEMDVPPWQNNC